MHHAPLTVYFLHHNLTFLPSAKCWMEWIDLCRTESKNRLFETHQLLPSPSTFTIRLRRKTFPIFKFFSPTLLLVSVRKGRMGSSNSYQRSWNLMVQVWYRTILVAKPQDGMLLLKNKGKVREERKKKIFAFTPKFGFICHTVLRPFVSGMLMI